MPLMKEKQDHYRENPNQKRSEEKQSTLKGKRKREERDLREEKHPDGRMVIPFPEKLLKSIHIHGKQMQ